MLDLETRSASLKGFYRVILAIIFALLLTFTTTPVYMQSCSRMRERMDEGEEKDGGSGQYDLDASFTNTSGKFLLAHECSHLHTLLMKHLFLRLQQFSQLSREEGEEKTVFASLEKQESHGTGWP